MLAWRFDADNIDIGDITPDNIYQYAVVRTPAVEAFLRYGAEDRKYFVVAPKGLGKTFLLKVKSKFYRENVSGYRRHCIPSGDELVEKLTSITVSFSKEDLGRFKSVETWEKTWELSLLTMILRNFNIELPLEMKNVIGDARTLLDILSTFLGKRSALDKLYSDHVASFLRPKIGELHSQGVNQIAIFIDNIDEGMEKHGSNRENTSGTLSPDVWVNAQLGMMKVVRNICIRYKHIKIFVSIRSEAFDKLEAQTALQYQDIASILTYTKTQIKEIFEQNISITKTEQMVKPDVIDPIERFVGFSSMDHRFVKDNGKPRKEDTFDFIFRHTFGRPREIVLMGSKIEEISVNERKRDEEAVREMVNSVSSDILLKQLKMEIVPYFQEGAFDRFCKLVQSNVISTKEAEKIANEISDYVIPTGQAEKTDEISDYHQFNNLFSYLYSLGLVGITEYDFRREHLVQRFLPVGRYSLSNNEPPAASKYFVVHSAVDKTLKNIHGRHFYDVNNIIGNGLSFQEPRFSTTETTEISSKVLHTHFGLGRDSLTLIIPELNKGKSIAIIQKPSKDERELSQAQFVEIRTGNYDPIKFKVVNDRLTETQINEAIAQWENGENILIYSNKPQIIGKVLNLSETITLWSSNFLGPAQEGDLLPSLSLDELNSDTRRKVVYLCQRVINKRIMNALRNQIKSKDLDERISVETTLVDRLEYKTSKFQENNTLIYAVEAEEYGSIICQERADSKNQNNDIVRRTKSLEEQRFYEDRQRYLKEGNYRLTKIIKKGSVNRQIENLDEIYNLFFDIQIANLVSRHRYKLNKIYPDNSQTQIILKLKEYCNRDKDRFDKLTKMPAFVAGQTSYIRDSKRMGAFPNDKTFFQMAKQSPLFTNSQIVLELGKLLEIKPLRDYYSVFVCFSARDEGFAKKISDSLKKRGVDTYFFREDHRPGAIKAVEKKEIAERDKILFVVSENSITSDECQQELTLGITKRQGRLNDPPKEQVVKDIFIPIRIDSYIWEVYENTLESRLIYSSREGWKNMQIIKEQAISDFSQFRSEQANRDFEDKVDAEIMPALIKGNNRLD